MDVFSHFTVHKRDKNYNHQVTCNNCKSNLTAPKQLLGHHLGQVTMAGVKPCPKAPDDVASLFRKLHAPRKRKLNSDDMSTIESLSSSSSHHSSASTRQFTLEEAWDTTFDAAADAAWAKFAHAEGIPFAKFNSLVQGSHTSNVESHTILHRAVSKADWRYFAQGTGKRSATTSERESVELTGLAHVSFFLVVYIFNFDLMLLRVVSYFRRQGQQFSRASHECSPCDAQRNCISSHHGFQSTGTQR
jgi:hypothetical protein